MFRLVNVAAWPISGMKIGNKWNWVKFAWNRMHCMATTNTKLQKDDQMPNLHLNNIIFFSIGLYYICFAFYALICSQHCSMIDMEMGRVRSHFNTPHTWLNTWFVVFSVYFLYFFFVRLHDRRTLSTSSSNRMCFRYFSHWKTSKSL